VKEAKQLQYDFHPQWYIKKLAQLQYCQPKMIQLTLPGNGKVIPVTWFPFINMLYLLLSDPDMALEVNNLDVNPANPFGKYELEGNYLSTVNSVIRIKWCWDGSMLNLGAFGGVWMIWLAEGSSRSADQGWTIRTFAYGICSSHYIN
jgi:hypothetical protein